MPEGERNQRLTEMQTELNPPTPAADVSTSAAPAAPAAGSTQGAPPRIGTFDPLPANFDKLQDVVLLGDNS